MSDTSSSLLRSRTLSLQAELDAHSPVLPLPPTPPIDEDEMDAFLESHTSSLLGMPSVISSVWQASPNLHVKPQVSGATQLSQQQSISLLESGRSRQASAISLNVHRARWESTLLNAIQAVVAIKTVQNRYFDTDSAGSYNATGFVVGPDLILSNRHVVSSGPITARAVFSDYEEISIYPVYRDPVHDFGFFRFDPSQLRFMKPQPLKLNPSGAKVGVDIRVIGNDAGEQLSILQGTIARLDRTAPYYGIGNYTDFNTFYIQAASSTSGGSSGSPVLNIDGQVIALNAGAASNSSQSYFLPLERVSRTLELLISGDPVSRGTIQTEWIPVSLHDALRLGLSREWEVKIREQFPDKGSVLAVKSIVPGGSAYGQLEEGDVLLMVNDRMICSFVELEDILDSSVHADISIQVCRAEHVKLFQIGVEDLQNLMPATFVEFGDGVVHELSYMMAKHFNINVSGVYVSCGGFILANGGIDTKSLITHINGSQIRDLSSFIDCVSKISSGTRAIVKYKQLDRHMKTHQSTILVDFTYFPFKLATRNDRKGLWEYRDIETNATLTPCKVRDEIKFDFLHKPKTIDSLAETYMVVVETHVPFLIDGVGSTFAQGPGIVVDPYLGLILTDRNSVPTKTSLVYATFSNHQTIQCQVVFMHPKYPLVFLSYPIKKDETGVLPLLKWWDGKEGLVETGATTSLPYSMQGMQVRLLQFDEKGHTVNSTYDKILGFVHAEFPLGIPPRFRPINLDTLRLEKHQRIDGSGIIMTLNGRICGFNLGFSGYGNKHYVAVPSFPIAAILNRIRAFSLKKGGTGNLDGVFHLDVELSYLSITNACKLGIANEWIDQLKSNSRNRMILQVSHVGLAFEGEIEEGDVILAVNGKIISDFSTIESMEFFHNKSSPWIITCWRGGKEVTCPAPLHITHFHKPVENNQLPLHPQVTLPSVSVGTVVGFAGIIVIEAGIEIARQMCRNWKSHLPNSAKHTKVDLIWRRLPYISCIMKGTPADAAGVNSGYFILNVGNVNLLESCIEGEWWKELLSALRKHNDCAYTRLSLISRDGKKRVVSLIPDEHYWPTWLLSGLNCTISYPFK